MDVVTMRRDASLSITIKIERHVTESIRRLSVFPRHIKEIIRYSNNTFHPIASQFSRKISLLHFYSLTFLSWKEFLDCIVRIFLMDTNMLIWDKIINNVSYYTIYY